MKTIQETRKATALRWKPVLLRAFFLVFVLSWFGLSNKALGFAYDPPPTPPAEQQTPTTEKRAKEILDSMRTVAGVLLVVALIISAVAAAFGQYKLTVGVVMGGLVLYATVWFMGMIVDAVGPDIDTSFPAPDDPVITTP